MKLCRFNVSSQVTTLQHNSVVLKQISIFSLAGGAICMCNWVRCKGAIHDIHTIDDNNPSNCKTSYKSSSTCTVKADTARNRTHLRYD